MSNRATSDYETVRPPVWSRSYWLAKRAFDLTAALMALIVLSPLIAILAVMVRVKLGSPVIFSQIRPGQFERTFTLHKYRTMTNATDSEGRPLPDADRLTPFGRFLRKTSLDELPELWNVVKGQMSLVGPRPLLVEYLPYYTERERIRFQVPPGITGISQISGRNLLNWDDRGELDVQYIERASYLTDLKVLFSTVGAVLFSRGVATDSRQVEPSLATFRSGLKQEISFS